jgi:hypothetical protein
MRKYGGHMGKYGQNIMVNIIPRTYGKMHRTYGKMKKYRKNIEKIHLGHMGKNGGHMATGTLLGHMGKYGGHMTATLPDGLSGWTKNLNFFQFFMALVAKMGKIQNHFL